MPMTTDGIATSLASRGIWEAGRFWIARIRRWRFAHVFGPDAIAGELCLVAGALVPPVCLDAKGNRSPFVLTKSGIPGSVFSAALVVSYCELRVTKYLADSIAVNAGKWSKLASDENVRTRQDLSFVSFGLTSNLKTLDLLGNTANQLVDYRDGEFVSKLSGRKLISPSANSDFGLILKVNPSNLSEKTWICCAGFGEWGTSGAAWFLARKWREIRSSFGRRPFAIIVKVRPSYDESAEVVVKAGTPEEIERYARD